MKKTLSLLLALVMVIGLFPVFADEAPALTADEAGAVLQGYGAIKGDSNGDLMIDKELKRQDAVVILTRLMGKDKEVEAMPKETKASFEDITIDYYQPFLAFAESNKWIEGKAEKKFGFNDVVTVKEFSAMLLRALGHDTMGENYAKVMDLAKEQGLFKGAMVEENANLVRGIAFILMNNTLETAPKGEDKALVYKLGYKEEPKPENLTVVSAEAAGLKAIDVKFSKAVSEKSLAKGISVKDGSNKVTFEVSLMDEMTARLVLNAVAKQDAKYMVTVDGVKSADMMEAVEKYEAAVFMTDQVRPEVLSVEALNPKTLLVKTSEPIDKEVKSFATLKEFKIADKALVGKVNSDLEKNEMIVELYTALKAGEHKLEVTGLKDFAGFIAKTAEFDVTVVEDKDAPVATEATMVNLKTIKVMFNEPLSQKGQFRVDGKPVTPASNIVLGKDKKTVTLAISDALGMGAITEVKVEYKGQKDIMANEVKDWTKLTFKVEDDTTLPEVKSVELDENTIVVTFTKNMDTAKGSYTLKKADKVVIAKTSANGMFDKEDAAVLKIDASSAIAGKDAATYTLILEGFIDGTVRKNEMAKVEETIAVGDTKKPTVDPLYVENDPSDTEKLLIKMYFSEEMDSATLLDKKNFTFMGYKYEATGTPVNKRADEVASKFNFEIDDAGKTLVIQATDPKVNTFTSIKVVGLKDKAGNMMDSTDLGKNTAAQKMNAEFVTKNDAYYIKMTFDQGIKVLPNDTYKLEGDGGKNLNLALSEQSEDNKVFYFSFDQTDVTAGMKHKATDLSLSLVDGTKAKSVFGKDAVAPTSFTDKVAPSVAKDEDGKNKISLDSDKKILTVEFNEDLGAGSVVTIVDQNGKDIKLQALTFVGNKLTIKRDSDRVFPNGVSKLTIVNAVDKSGNVAKDLGSFELEKIEKPLAEIESLTNPTTAANQDLVLKTTALVEYGIKVDDGTTYNAAAVKGQFVVKHFKGDTEQAAITVDDITSIDATGITLDISDVTFAAGDVVKVIYTSENKLIDSANGTPISSKEVSVTVE